jgi:lipopolysaccharide transport system ATP-binding protein
MKPIITVENVSKQYRIGASDTSYENLREIIVGAVGAPFRWAKGVGNGKPRHETIWALKDINFEVEPGEVVGIIGGNGAGKSTLLKLLSRITEPTTGRIALYGRIGSLLEVGTGFHPELSGRENVYLNGAILGMTRVEIARKFDEIVAFSEIGKFIDTPVKYYSSGMYMRLAFAVAAHFEPEILIVDEVLAVGDASFQKKCLGKMGEVAEHGRTVLFVSHNITAIQALCKRAIWLSNGKIVEEAEAGTVVSHYLRVDTVTVTEKVWNDPVTAPGNHKVRIHRVCVRPVNGSSSDLITIRTPLVLEFDYWNLEPDARLNLSIHVSNKQGVTSFNTAPVHEPVWHGRSFPVGLFRSACYIPGDLLNDGMHRVLLLVVKDQTAVIYSHNDALVFDIKDSVERRGNWYGEWVGAVRPDLEWRTELLTQELQENTAASVGSDIYAAG